MSKKRSQVQPAQLTEFGLDPFEWILLNDTGERAEFTNIDDPEIRINALLDATSSTVDISSMEWVI